MALPARHRAHLRQGTKYALGALLVAVLSCIGTLYVTHRSNNVLIEQQQQLGELQKFEETGGQLDGTVQQFSDALAEGAGASSARKAVKNAASSHASSAFIMRDTLGDDYPPYAKKISEIRDLADNATTPRDGVKVFQSLADLIAMRRNAASHVKAKVAAS